MVSYVCIVFVFPIECPQSYETNEYDLKRIIISTEYYGSCNRCESINKFKPHRFNSENEKSPLLGPLRASKGINIRIFSLGVLFIGGATIGSYLLYQQGKVTHSSTHSLNSIYRLAILRSSLASQSCIRFR